ncbi:MAG: hypothetical protein P0Y58_26555 [Candidatus Pseudomonas phytovorans]|uniref:Uncharacterized protein n=1 Tax=Candidatus Pseudomonas phytovorans TaxID=3121377 RepID=A0AAJ6BD62_9PSED|nr:hypothetical protein [Pseudomonas sp.]WEK30411.1 MAG: hypothetical protein P0Y58_26555 [Pseudomonas sp.]
MTITVNTDKPLYLKASSAVLASLCGLVLLYPGVSSAQGQPDKQNPFSIICEKENNCTYQIKGARPGTTSWVYELAGLKLAIPDDFVPEFVSGPAPAPGGRVFAVWFPDFTPATSEQRKQGLLSDDQKGRDIVLFEFYQNDPNVRPVRVEELEQDMVSRRSAPQPVSAIPSLQEYAVPGKPSFFRSTDLGIRYPDGLPVYFGCLGDPIAFGYDPVVNAKNKKCIMQMTWPNGFILKLHFDQSQLPQWRTILEKGTEYFKTLEANHRLPSGTLALD